MKLSSRLLLYPEMIAFLVTGVLACGDGNIGDLRDAGVDAPSCLGSEPVTVYRDGDGDGYGDPNQPVSVCGSVEGFVSNNDDCHDGDAEVSPEGTEVCGDGIDNDCAGGDPCQASLLAHWPLDDGDGDTARDASGHDHSGTLNNSPQWSQDGSYLHFDGAERYVAVAHDPSFLVDEGTVVLWFRVDELSLAHGLWSKDSSGLDTGGHLTINTTAEVVDGAPAMIRVRLQNADDTVGDGGNFILFSPGLEAGRWYHVAVAFGPEGMRLHLDTTLVDTNVYTGGLGQTAGGVGNEEPIVIGAGSWGSDDFSATPIAAPHQGDLFDVRFYGRALSTDEIADLYVLTKPGQ